MSRINFDTLERANPELSSAWKELRRWFDRYRRIDFVELPRLARELRNVREIDLAIALLTMVEAGLLSEAMGIEGPDGELLEYLKPNQNLPERVLDRSERTQYDRHDLRLVPGYLLTETSHG